MSLNDVIIKKTTGGIIRTNEEADMISGMITTGVAVAGGVQLGTVYTLTSVKSAEALKINADYDADTANAGANPKLLYYNIKEFFRMNPSGKLFLLVVAQEVALADVELTDLVDKANADYLKKLLLEANGEIRQVGVFLNPDVAYTDTITDGIADDVLTAADKAQELYTEEAGLHRPVHILLEGRGLDISKISSTLDDLNEKLDPNVSIIVGADRAVSNSNARYNNHAAVGTVLGAVSKAKVHESIAWVEKFNVADSTNFAAPGLSGNNLVSEADANLATLDSKRYIFFIKHIGQPGVYINNDHSATVETDDYGYIKANRTIDKAIRLIRAKLLPKLGSPLKADANGKLAPVVAKNFEAYGQQALDQMVKDEEVSAADVVVSLDQDIVTSKNLEVKFDIIPIGSADKITVTIGFKAILTA